MFPLRDEHNDAFRKVAREEFPNHFARILAEQGYEVDHDQQQRLMLATDKRGNQTRYHFDENSRVERTISPEGVEAKLSFDDEGRLIGQKNPASQFQIKRDSKGRMTEVGTSAEVNYKFGRDQRDRVNSIEYPDQKSVEVDFDPVENYPVRIRDRSGQETHFEYRGNGSITTDPLGRKTIMHADNGRLQEIEFPDGSKQSYAISEDLKVLSITRRDGSVVRQENDDATNTMLLHWPDGQTTVLHRDDKGQLAFGENDTTDVISEYDDAGNVISEETPEGTVLFESDELQQTTKLTLPNGSEYHYQYDGDNRLSSIKAWDDQKVSIGYGADGMPHSILFPNGITESLKVTSFGRLAGSTIANAAGQTLGSQSYTYDVCEKLIGLEESWVADTSTSTKQNQRSIRFKYDDDFRVLSAKDTANKQVLESYEYDLKGNLIASNGSPCPVGVMDQPLNFGGQAIKYDGLGNMVQLPGEQGTIQVSYAGNGVVEKTVVAGRETTYEYDPFGRRIRKTTGKETWKYGWADRQLLWEEHQQSPDGPVVRREYLYAPHTFAPIGFREGDDVYWMHSDARDAVTSVTDKHGNLVWRATYDSFGTATLHVEKVRQPWRLAGQYYDQETGLHCSQARYYSPLVKSYLSIDSQWHRRTTTNYSYVRNDPWNLQDPVGTEPASITVGGVLSVLAAGAAAVSIGAGIGAGIAYLTGDDPYAGAVEGGFAALGAFIGIAGGPVGILVGGFIGGLIGVGLGTLVRAYNRGTPLTLECLWQELLTGLAIEVVVTLVTLGLSKIPGVKPLMKFLGDKIDDAFRAMKGKLGTLAGAAADGVKKRFGVIPESNLLKKLGAIAGVDADHLARLKRFAGDRGEMVIVRKPNPESLKYHGVDGYRPKPLGLPGTAKTDSTGLVKWKGDGPPPKGPQKYGDETYTYGDDGYLRDSKGNQLYSDYDLQGSYKPDGTRIDTNDPGYQNDINDALGTNGNSQDRMVQHGANDNYRKDGKMGRQPDPDEEYLVVHPDGTEEVIDGTDNLQRFYEENGMHWPYQDY